MLMWSIHMKRWQEDIKLYHQSCCYRKLINAVWPIRMQNSSTGIRRAIIVSVPKAKHALAWPLTLSSYQAASHHAAVDYFPETSPPGCFIPYLQFYQRLPLKHLSFFAFWFCQDPNRTLDTRLSDLFFHLRVISFLLCSRGVCLRAWRLCIMHLLH